MKTLYVSLCALCALAAALFLNSCGTSAGDAEKAANEKLSETGAQYRPAGAMPQLPELSEASPFEDYLAYALLKSPEVERAYYEWASSVASITVARSLPDPRVTFQMDIQRGFIPSVMPGIAFDVPGPGKLANAAETASAGSETKRQALVAKVLEAALALEKPCWELEFVDAKLESLKKSLKLLEEMEAQARALNAAGKSTTQDVLRAQIEQERLKAETLNLEESREPLLESFKAALGLKPEEQAPPFPAKVPDFPSGDLVAKRVLEEALKSNPGLKALEAELRQAESSLSMARKAQIPDFTAGGELDALAIPVLFRPMASMSLPIWREKIVAGIAAAQASKRASEAKLSAAQIALAVQCAEKRYLAKEASRNLETLNGKLVPKAAQALEASRLAYSSNGVDFLTLLEAERTLLRFHIDVAAATLQRNLATAELALALSGKLPPEAEFLQEGPSKRQEASPNERR